MKRLLLQGFWFVPNQKADEANRALVLVNKPDDMPHYHEVLIDMSLVEGFFVAEGRKGIEIPASAVLYPFTQEEWDMAEKLDRYLAGIVGVTRTPRRNDNLGHQ